MKGRDFRQKKEPAQFAHGLEPTLYSPPGDSSTHYWVNSWVFIAGQCCFDLGVAYKLKTLRELMYINNFVTQGLAGKTV